MKQLVVERKIMWGDLDPLGIVFYPRYYEWIDACAHLFFESIGLPVDALWEKRKILFGLIETSCQYKRPGRYHESIKIVTQMETLTEKTLKLKHTILRASDDGVMLIAFESRICMCVADPKHIRSSRIPEDIFSVLEKAMHQGKS